jgi:hypothetical protein
VQWSEKQVGCVGHGGLSRGFETEADPCKGNHGSSVGCLTVRFT